MKNADEGELKAIASSSEHTHVYNVADFNVMEDIVDVLTRTVCERMETLHKQLAGLRRSHVTCWGCHVIRNRIFFCLSCRWS